MTATIETTSTPVAATTIALRRGVLPVRRRSGASELAGEADAGGAAFDTGLGMEAAASVGCRCVVGVARFFAPDVAALGFDFFRLADDVRVVEAFGARAGFLPASADTSSVQRTA